MTPVINGPRTKVRRAQRQLKVFERKATAATDGSDPFVRVVKTFDAADNAYVLTVEEVGEIDLNTLLLLDEATHHLRSALDQLVFAVALADSGSEQNTTQFPLLSNPDDWDKGDNGKRTQDAWLAGVSDDHRAIIERHQPYHPWSVDGIPHPHPLKVLNDLSNDQKHRIVQSTYPIVLALNVEVPTYAKDCTIDPGRMTGSFVREEVVGCPLKPQTELARIPVVISGPEPDLGIQLALEFYVGFRNGIGWHGLTFAAATVEGLIDELAGALDSPRVEALWAAVESRFKEPTEVERLSTRTIEQRTGLPERSP